MVMKPAWFMVLLGSVLVLGYGASLKSDVNDHPWEEGSLTEEQWAIMQLKTEDGNSPKGGERREELQRELNARANPPAWQYNACFAVGGLGVIVGLAGLLLTSTRKAPNHERREPVET
jgi:hypothetical protein